MSKLTMHIPKCLEGWIDAQQRYAQGSDATNAEILDTHTQLQALFSEHQDYQHKLNHLIEVEWEKEKIEDFYEQKKWYNAHSRRRRYEQKIETAHRHMFYLLLAIDKNNEEFSSFSSFSPQDIMADFYRKYSQRYALNRQRKI